MTVRYRVSPYFPLSANVPDVELESLGLDGLDVEPLGGGDGRDVLAGEGLEDGRLASVIKTQEQDPQLPVRRRLQLSEKLNGQDFKRISPAAEVG